MSPSRDAFGFTSKTRPQSPEGTNPLVVLAQPGQEIRVVIADDGGLGGVSQGSPDKSGNPSPDKSGNPSPDKSGNPSPDKSGNPSPDNGFQNPFGFKPLQLPWSLAGARRFGS